MTPAGTCSLDDCDKPRGTTRLCRMHYTRLIRHGDVNWDRRKTDHVKRIGTFWAHVHKTATCWLWTGAITDKGYGYFRVKGMSGSGAHRFAWIFSGRPTPPEGMHLDHLCRVTHCVNPDHLEIVTPQVNTLRGIGPTALNAKKPCCPKCGGEYQIAKRGHLKPGRWCPPCHAERRRQRKQERREAAA